MNSSIAPEFSIVMKRGFKERIMIPAASCGLLKMEKMDEATLHTSLGSSVVSIAKCSGGGSYFTKGWKDFVLKHDIKIRDLVSFVHEGCNVFKVFLYDSTGRYKLHNLSEGPSEGKRPFGQAATTAASRKPRFMVKIVESNHSQRYPYLNIPADFARSNGFCHKTRVILRDESGNTWHSIVKALVRSEKHTRTTLTRGWDEFLASKKLETGDVCIFELNSPRNRRPSEPIVMDVLIFPQPKF